MAENRPGRRKTEHFGRKVVFFLGIVLAVIFVAFFFKNLLSNNEDTVSITTTTGSEQTSDTTEAEESETESETTTQTTTRIATSATSTTAKEADVTVSPESLFYEAELPMLINASHALPSNYKPDLVSIGNGFSLERRAAAAWGALETAAAKDGVSIWAISAYRSIEKQQSLFDNGVKKRMNNGMSKQEAEIETAKWIAYPGKSEHNSGFAVDVNEVNESFENTKTFKWLQNNAYKYGFILRYPKNKVSVTGISYEPWHYRYVGSNHAVIIKNKGFALEEYIDYASR